MARSHATKPGNLSEEVQKILREYEDEVDHNLGEITKKLGKKGARQLTAASRRAFPKGTGEYAAGWKADDYSDRVVKTTVIHNATLPGLPHLLEHGHVGYINGKRIKDVKGREHIHPVEKELVEAYEKEVLAKL